MKQSNTNNKAQGNEKEKIQKIESIVYYFVVNNLMDQYFIQFMKNS